MAFNTPFKMWKRYEFNGGTARPVHHLLAGRDEGPRRDPRPVPPRDRHRPDDPRHASASSRPRRSRATPRARSTASACASSLDDASAPSARKTQFYAMLGSRSIWHEGWKAVTTHPTIAGWGHFNDDEWELYHTDVDRSELHNLAAEQPGQAARAGQHLVLGGRRERRVPARRPLAGRDPHARPGPSSPRRADRYVYYPDAAPVSEWQAVNTRNRSFVIGALVDIPAPGAEGVLFAIGLPLRRPRALRQGQPAALRQQLRRQRGADGRRLRGHPDRRRT